MAIRCIALDYSGTLAPHSKSPTIEDIVDVWRQMEEPINEPMLNELDLRLRESKRQYSGFGKVHAWDELLKSIIVKYSKGLNYESFADRLWTRVPDSQMCETAIQVVMSLHRRGYRLFLASNTRRPASARLKALKQSGALDCFDETFISSDLGFGKPDPEFYKTIMVQAGDCLPREFLFVGDSLVRDVIEPMRHGMNAVWLNRKRSSDLTPKGIPEIVDIAQLPALLEKNLWQ